MGNPVVHFEIIGGKGKRLQSFYGKVFDWKIDSNNPMKYGVTDTKGRGNVGINGGIMAASGPNVDKCVTVYVQVKSVTAHLAKVKKAGGKVMMPRTVVPGMVTFGLFTDPVGNIVGVVEASTPPAPKPKKAKKAKKRSTKKRSTKKRSTKKRSTKKRSTKKRAAKKRAAKKRSTKKRTTKKRTTKKRTTKKRSAKKK